MLGLVDIVHRDDTPLVGRDQLDIILIREGVAKVRDAENTVLDKRPIGTKKTATRDYHTSLDGIGTERALA